MLIRVHHREGVPEAFESTREGHSAGNEGELRCLRRGQVVGSGSEQTHEKASRRPILLLRHLHLSHGAVEKGNKISLDTKGDVDARRNGTASKTNELPIVFNSHSVSEKLV